MKKILFSIAALAVAFGFTACSNEDEALSNAKNEKATVVAMTEVGTRTALSGDDTNGYDVVWSGDDQITIGSETFTIKSGVGTTTATFEGTAPDDGDYIAYYGISTDKIFGTQHYKAGKVSNFPMYAKTTVKDGKIEPLQFKNFGGILSLTIKGTATIKSIIIKADQYLSGQLVQLVLYNDDYYFNTSNRACQLTLDCGKGIALTSTGTVFNIAMIPYDENGSITYTGVKITLIDTNNKTYTKTFNGTSGLVIERSKITRASFTAEVADETTGKAKAKIKGVDTDVNWVQLWPDGPKFAEYNVADKMNFVYAYQTDDNFVWGSNWRLPSEEDFTELRNAVSPTEETRNNSKVTCVYDPDQKGYIFTGKQEGYTNHTVFFPGEEGQYGNTSAYYWAISTVSGWEAAYLCIKYNINNNKWNSEVSGCRYKTTDEKRQTGMYFVRPVLAE